MARTNTPAKGPRTYEGAPAVPLKPVQALKRSVMSCMLWESEFYEDGQTIADRIASLSAQVTTQELIAVAKEAKDKMHLRHVPLYLAVQLLVQRKQGREVGDAITHLIQRADELAEFVAMYWKQADKKSTPKQMKRGLAQAFDKFTEFQFAKYDRDGAVKLRDVLFLCHPKPKDEAQAALFKKIANKELTTTDTWEVMLSGGGDKKATFEKLMAEGNLGGLAFLRNLRGMTEAKVDPKIIKEYFGRMNFDKTLPFRFIAAATHAPQFGAEIEAAMLKSCANLPKLLGRTVLLVDNSGSMYGTKISAKSDLDRASAAQALAMLLREICEDCSIISFSKVPAWIPTYVRGLSLGDAISRATSHASTETADAVALANARGYDRLILITDEQARSYVPNPIADKAYCINVASAKNGIGYGKWTHIDGFSEAVVQYIQEFETLGD